MKTVFNNPLQDAASKMNEDWYLKNSNGNFIAATVENFISLIEGDGKPKKPYTEEENRATEKRYLKMGYSVKCYYEDMRNVTEFLN